MKSDLVGCSTVLCVGRREVVALALHIDTKLATLAHGEHLRN
jgi:hypothetical protein